MTAYNIIKSLSKRGNSVLGSGCYAAALSSTVDGNKVIKVGNNTNDPWLDYYEVIKANQNNPCVPRIYSFYIDTAHNYYVCVMERLTEQTFSPAVTEAMDFCKEFVEGWFTDEEFLADAAKHAKHIPYPEHMLALLKQVKDQTDYVKGEEVPYEVDGGRMLDMHHGNFLMRDDTIIVTDPWCEANMEDIDDVNYWASRHNVG